MVLLGEDAFNGWIIGLAVGLLGVRAGLVHPLYEVIWDILISA